MPQRLGLAAEYAWACDCWRAPRLTNSFVERCPVCDRCATEGQPSWTASLQLTSSNGEVTTHHSIEDLAWLRAIPGLTVIVPTDRVETAQAIRWAAGAGRPVFIRVSRMGVPDVMPEGYEFQPGRAVELRSGRDVTIVATGTTVSRGLEAAAALEGDGVSARVLAMPTIKPLDGDALLAAARETGGIVTVEEALTSGLGGAVAEHLATRHPTPMRFVGVPDTFAPTGSEEWLLDHFGINAAGIAAAAKEVLATA